MKSVLAKQQDATLQLTISIPADVVKKTWDKIIELTVKQADVPGFRKGKAPKKLVEEKLDKTKIREETLKELLPTYYIKAVEEHKIRPIINPKIHIEKLDDPSTPSGQTDWEFTAITCEAPQIKLGDYKQKIQGLTAKSKIVIPGKTPEPVKFDDIVKTVLESVTVEIPKILIDQETDRLLSQTLDEIKRLGLMLDQYLASTNKTAEALRKEYEEKARADITIEFTLQKIADVETITVDEEEIDKAIKAAKDENEKKHLESNRYLLASILRQQKTLDFLRNL